MKSSISPNLKKSFTGQVGFSLKRLSQKPTLWYTLGIKARFYSKDWQVHACLSDKTGRVCSFAFQCSPSDICDLDSIVVDKVKAYFAQHNTKVHCWSLKGGWS